MSNTILESNQMQITTQVVAPPSTAMIIYPVKDMFITKQYPVFSFGEYAQLFVRKNNDSECRTIISFDIPAIEDNIWKNFIDCKIKITFRDVPRATTIVLKQVEDDGWSETGVTWAGKPVVYPETLATYNIDENTKTIYYDIQDFLMGLKGEPGNFAFSIRELNDNDQTTDIDIYSKESSVDAMKPQIVAEYEYFPDNPDLADLTSSVVVRINDEAEFPSRGLKVKNGIPAPADLSATMRVKGYSTYADGPTFSLYTVAKTVKDVKFSCVVQRWTHKDFRAPGFRLPLKHANAELSVPNFNTVIYRHEIPASLTILQYKGREDILAGDFAVRKHDKAELDSSIIVPSHKDRAQLEMTLSVSKVIPPIKGGEDDPPLQPEILQLYEDSSLRSRGLTVKSYEDNAEFSMSCSVMSRADLAGSIFIKYYEDEAELECENLYVRPHADLIADDFSVNKIDEKVIQVFDFYVRPSWAHDMTVRMKIVKDQRKPYAFIM